MKISSAKVIVRKSIIAKIWRINECICNEDPIPKELQELFEHFQNQFTSDMNWHNYTDVWEIDHIKPLAKFETAEQIIAEANELSNLKPEYLSINRRKLNLKK